MKSKIEKFVTQIFETADEEISCTDCLRLISEYVERELAHTADAPAMPAVRQHLGQCRVCRDEYQVLSELARLDAQGRAPSEQDLI